MDESSARSRVLAALGSGLASQDKLAADTGLPEAAVGVELASAEAAGLASRIELAGETTWRITGAGLLYGVFPDPEPPSVSLTSAAQRVSAGPTAVQAAGQDGPAGPELPGEAAAVAAGVRAPVDDAWRGWAQRWLRHAYDQDRLESEQVLERLDAVAAAATLLDLDRALRGVVRVPVVEASERG
ncbi:hypothetical protein [Nocardioides sp.]|uniref:hypothetical protein n=1 Tax=Nocardioides sp. TaxID=35761 RepID=UPI003527EF81